jgi:hypothetical protein
VIEESPMDALANIGVALAVGTAVGLGPMGAQLIVCLPTGDILGPL